VVAGFKGVETPNITPSLGGEQRGPRSSMMPFDRAIVDGSTLMTELIPTAERGQGGRGGISGRSASPRAAGQGWVQQD
jgi:hypothetical protein